MKSPIGNERYRQYSNARLLEAFALAHARLVDVTQNLTVEEWVARPLPGKWSILEIVMHLADAELIGACRFRLVLSDFKGSLPVYQQDVLASKLRYNEQSQATLRDSLILFGILRQTSLTLLNQCSEGDWNKTGIHPERGEMTLRGLLELYADHSERHIGQILVLRKLLGKSLTYELLLKERLY